jgi:hypothetical protein
VHHAKRQAEMKNITSKISVWSPDDLRNYLARAVGAYKEDEHWPHLLTTLINGLETSDSVPLGTQPLNCKVGDRRSLTRPPRKWPVEPRW